MNARIAAILGLWTAACASPEGDYFGAVDPDPDPSHFRYCNSGEPEWVDPALSTSTTGTPLARLMFAGLADFGDDAWGSAVPSIATHWDIAPDLRTFTFHLRDDVTWSNGRPLTSADFVYHVSRILHPVTASRNTTPLEPIKNATLYIEGRVKMLTEDVPPFRKGDIVEVVGLDGKSEKDPTSADIPDSNLRRSSKVLHLRDLGKSPAEAYATVPANQEIHLIELSPDRRWAYVFYMGPLFKWNYGWIPVEDLDIQPNGTQMYTVREIPPEHRLGVSLPPDKHAQRKAGTAPGTALLMIPEVLGVRAPNPHTFVIETWAPTPYILSDINKRPYRPTPRESVARSPEKWTQPQNGLLVTSGAFTMTDWVVRDKMEFVKSQTFFDKDTVSVDRITVYSISDQAASANLFYQGGCDASTANNVPYSYIPMLSGQKRGGRPYKDFQTVPYDGIYYYVMNVEKMTNRHFRRALTMAVDRSLFPALLNGGEIPSSSFVPGIPISALGPDERKLCKVAANTPGIVRIVEKGTLCYVPPRGLEYDPARAKEELALAKEQPDFDPKVELIFNMGSEGHKIVAEYLQQEWKRNLGIDVSLSTMEWKTYLEETKQGNFQMARMGWIGGSPNPEGEYHLVFKCNSPYNRSRWCSEEYDRLYKEAQAMTDQKLRLQTLQRAEEVLLQDAPIVPLYVYTQKLLQRPYVEDLFVNMGNNPPLHRVRINPNWKRLARPGAAP